MPIIKSAKKRVRVANKAAIRNSKTKRSLKSALKAFHSSLTGDGKQSAASHAQAQSALDKAVKKGVIHKNKAARAKRKLAAKAKTSDAKSTASKKSAAKSTKAKAATKKSSTK